MKTLGDLLNLSGKIWQRRLIYGGGKGTLRNWRLQHFIGIGETLIFYLSYPPRALLEHLTSLYHAYQLDGKQDLIGQEACHIRGVTKLRKRGGWEENDVPSDFFYKYSRCSEDKSK